MRAEEQRRINRREANGYPSDLRDVEGTRLEPMIPPARPGGRPRKTDLRAAMNAIAIQDRDKAARPVARTDTWQVDAAVAKVPRVRLEIVKRSDAIKGSSSCRAIAGWSSVPSPGLDATGGSPRTSRTENLAETLATFVTLAAMQLTMRRFARA